MACNCGGSGIPQATQTDRAATLGTRTDQQVATPPRVREGGPGEPGYYWTGPNRVAEMMRKAPTG